MNYAMTNDEKKGGLDGKKKDKRRIYKRDM